MGRWFYNKKATVEESLDVTVFQLNSYGMLDREHSSTVLSWVTKNTGKESRIGLEVHMTGEPYVRFLYTVSDREGNQTPYDTEVRLVTTPCNLGGKRYWFICPTCTRRVGGLYCAPGEEYFMCRICNNLSYHSRNRELIGACGHTSRQIDKLRSEIRRRTWKGRPTRKVRRLRALERKMVMFSPQISARMEKLRRRCAR